MTIVNDSGYPVTWKKGKKTARLTTRVVKCGTRDITQDIVLTTECNPILELSGDFVYMVVTRAVVHEASPKTGLQSEGLNHLIIADAMGMYGWKKVSLKPSPDCVAIYTDGSYSAASGVGSWAYLVVCGDEVVGQDSGIVRGSRITSQVAELTAGIEALKLAIRSGWRTGIITDSMYLCQGINAWLKGWKNRSWRKSGGGLIENVGLWKEIAKLVNSADFTISHIKGHQTGNSTAITFNNMVDGMAVAAREEEEAKKR